MHRVEWLQVAFDQVGELIQNNPDRREEFATGLQRLARDLAQWPTEVGE